MKKIVLLTLVFALSFSLMACTKVEEEVNSETKKTENRETIDRDQAMKDFFADYEELNLEDLQLGDSVVIFGESMESMGLVAAERIILSDEELKDLPKMGNMRPENMGDNLKEVNTERNKMNDAMGDLSEEERMARREEMMAMRESGEMPEMSGQDRGSMRTIPDQLQYFGKILSLDLEGNTLVIENNEGGSILINLYNDTEILKK